MRWILFYCVKFVSLFPIFLLTMSGMTRGMAPSITWKYITHILLLKTFPNIVPCWCWLFPHIKIKMINRCDLNCWKTFYLKVGNYVYCVQTVCWISFTCYLLNNSNPTKVKVESKIAKSWLKWSNVDVHWKMHTSPYSW